MRNFSKTLISMAAVMAVGSAMAAGAMAADLTATYADGTVSIEGVTAGKSQYTLLVVQGEMAEGTDEYKYYAKTTTIKQIDQNDAGVPFTSTTVGELADGSYKVLVGNNDGTVDTGIFVVGGEEEPEVPPVEPEIIYAGDVDNSDSVDSSDAMYIFEYELNWWEQQKDENVAGYTAVTADERTLATAIDGSTTYYLGDVDRSGSVDSSDAMYIFEYEANWWEQQKDENAAGFTAFTADELEVLPVE